MTRFWFVFLFLFAGGPNTQADPLRIAVSILPQAEFVARVGGHHVTVTVLLPPGASPPTYDPKPSQLKEIERANLYILVGADFVFEKAWTHKIQSLNPNLTFVNSAEGIDLLQGHDGHEETDPHVWLSPKRTKTIVSNICKALSQADPDHADFYAQNRDTYHNDLDRLDAQITQILAPMPTRAFLIYHPAWTYFARDYHLEQIPIEHDGKDPTPKGIIALIHQAKQCGITNVFASPEFNTKSADVIAQALGGKVILISPLDRDYIQNMHRVAQVIAKP